jgi:hypothetical protein
MQTQERPHERTYLVHKYFTSATLTEAVREYGLWPCQSGFAHWICQQLDDVTHPAYLLDARVVCVARHGWLAGYSESLRNSPELRRDLLVYASLRGHGREGICVTVPPGIWTDLAVRSSWASEAAPGSVARGLWLTQIWKHHEVEDLWSQEEWMDDMLQTELRDHWAKQRAAAPRFISTAELEQALTAGDPNVQADCIPHQYLPGTIDSGPHPAYMVRVEPAGHVGASMVELIVRTKLKGPREVVTLSVRVPESQWRRMPPHGVVGMLDAGGAGGRG